MNLNEAFNELAIEQQEIVNTSKSHDPDMSTQGVELDVNIKLKEILKQVIEVQNQATEKGGKSQQMKDQLARLAELTRQAGFVFSSAKKPRPFNSRGNKIEIAANIRTFNLYLNLLVSALVIQLDLHRQLSPKLTTKELQQKKLSANHTSIKSSTESKAMLQAEPDYLEMAHHVFSEMKRGHYRGIHPDTFTCSQLLRGLKALSKQQQITGGGAATAGHGYQQVNQVRVQEYLGSLYQHFGFLLSKFARNSGTSRLTQQLVYDESSPSAFVQPAIDPILTNSFMDLCVRFSSPQMALGLFDRLHQVLRAVSSSQAESLPVKDSLRQNSSIQIGIVIKAHGLVAKKQQRAPSQNFGWQQRSVKNVDIAFDLFKKHQRWLLRTASSTDAVEEPVSSIFSRALEESSSESASHLAHQSPQQHNDITFGCLIDVLVRNGQVKEAETIFEDILNAQQGKCKSEDVEIWASIRPNTIIYTTMIKAYSKTQNLKAALRIFDLMLSQEEQGDASQLTPSGQSIGPNIITYNSIIDCCVRCQQMERAKDIFQLMTEKSNIQPDLITFSTLIKGYCRIKDIEMALILHQQMLDRGIRADEVLYNSLLDGCLKANHEEMALKCYQNMKKLRIKPSNVTYSILAKIYQKLGDLEKSFGLLDEMKADNITPGLFVFTCLMQTCLQQGMINQALSYFDEMAKNLEDAGSSVDWVGYSTIVQGCLDHQRYNEAIDLLLRAKNSLGQVPGKERQIWQLYDRLNLCLIDENNEVAVKRYADVNSVLNWFAKALGLDTCQPSMYDWSADNKENVSHILIHSTNGSNIVKNQFMQMTSDMSAVEKIFFQ